jgi:hypothetical protein
MWHQMKENRQAKSLDTLNTSIASVSTSLLEEVEEEARDYSPADYGLTFGSTVRVTSGTLTPRPAMLAYLKAVSPCLFIPSSLAQANSLSSNKPQYD